MEKLLLALGALQHNDSRLKRQSEEEDGGHPKRSIFQSSRASHEDNDDGDWD